MLSASVSNFCLRKLPSLVAGELIVCYARNLLLFNKQKGKTASTSGMQACLLRYANSIISRGEANLDRKLQMGNNKTLILG